MKIAILSRSLKCYSTRRLKEAALKRGHRALVLNTLRFSLNVEQEVPGLFYNNRPLSLYDAVLPRIGASITFYGLAVLRQFEQMGVFCMNTALPIAKSRDKLHSMQILSRHNIGLPQTAFVHRKTDVLPALHRLGGAPVIIKLLEGTQGVGVILAETNEVAQAIVETLQSRQQNVLMQKFVKESRGRDIRALVVGDRVVAAMRRQATGDEFRSNMHRGGSACPVELSSAYAKTAVRAAQILGLRVAGVDMLEGVDGPQIMEVNSSPGLQGIESATNIDVADAIIQEIENKVLFPEVDLRERLNLNAGYGIAELIVHDMAGLSNKSLREARLREKNIFVVSITRNLVTTPIPGPDEQILEGDKLLCYGELRALRGLMPDKGKHSRKRIIKSKSTKRPIPS